MNRQSHHPRYLIAMFLCTQSNWCRGGSQGSTMVARRAQTTAIALLMRGSESQAALPAMNENHPLYMGTNSTMLGSPSRTNAICHLLWASTRPFKTFDRSCNALRVAKGLVSQRQFGTLHNNGRVDHVGMIWGASVRGLFHPVKGAASDETAVRDRHGICVQSRCLQSWAS